MNELNLTQLFLLDGKPIVAPDEDVEMSFEDLDAAQSGRDESGFMHRIRARCKMRQEKTNRLFYSNTCIRQSIVVLFSCDTNSYFSRCRRAFLLW